MGCGCARRREWLLKKQAQAKARAIAMIKGQANEPANRVERGQGQRPQPGIRPDLAQHQDMDTQAG